MSNKQLYEKENNINKPFFPVVKLENIIDTISEKSIQWILNNYNHIYVEWKNNIVDTRLSVPIILRRNGLWITYNNGNSLITEYYIGKNTEIKDKHWQDDSNWEDHTNKLIDGSVEYRHLSESLKQLFNKSNITNFPDEEDLTSDGVSLKFKNREYNIANCSGLGKIILRKNIIKIDGTNKNYLTQNMINKSNTIYEIRYDFDLNDEEIIIPENCILNFKGGKLYNGIIIGNNTNIIQSNKFIFDNVLLNGSWGFGNLFAYWFGCKEDSKTDDTKNFKLALQSARILNKTCIVSGKLYVTETINVDGVKIKGEQKPSGNILYYTGKRVGNITFDFIKNINLGKTITFDEMINDRYNGSLIISDIANPILKVTKSNKGNFGFNLDSIGIIGWIRNSEQVGLKCEYDNTLTYLQGNHKFKNILVSACGNNGVEIQSLEESIIENCNFICNNGYGFKIEGIDDLDSPTEYITFNNCTFTANRLDSLYIKNSFRKQLTIANCLFQMPGQYEIGETDDFYGNRIIPETEENIISGLKIENGAKVGTTNRIAEDLIIHNCYGELVVKAIHLSFTLGSGVLNRVNYYNNSFTRLSGANNTIGLYLKANYMQDVTVYANGRNVHKNYVIPYLNTIYILHADKAFIDSIPTNAMHYEKTYTKINCNDAIISKITSDNIINKDYGIKINNGQEGTKVVTINIGTILAKYYPSNDSSTAKNIVTLLIGYHRNNPTMAAYFAWDIICFTKESNTSYLMYQITKNITSVSFNSSTGELSFECPSWCIAKIQQLDLINAYK